MATLCTSGAVKLKAGANAATLTEAQYDIFIEQAEGFICSSARYDFVNNYSSISNIGKKFLEDAASSHAAISVINYDMSGFTSRMEAQTMLDVNYAKLVDCVNLLRDEKFKAFVIKGEVEE